MKKQIVLSLLVIAILAIFSLSFTQQVNYVKGQEYAVLIKGIGVQDPGSIVDIPHRVIIDNNWSDMASTYDWCDGSGTEIDPYIIENIAIDSDYGGTCLLIKNADKFFVVRNCIFERSGREHEHDAGVRVKNASNGLIVSNNFSLNFHAVNVYKSSYITIRLNVLMGAHNDTTTGMGKAVYIFESHNITVQRNFGLNHYDGVISFDSLDIDIRDNVIVNMLFGYSVETGIYFRGTNYSSIVNNTLYGVIATVEGSSSIHTADEETFGILLVNSFFNTVYGNKFLEAGEWPVGGDTAIGGYEFLGIIISLNSIVIVVVFMVKRKYKIK